MSGRIKKHSTNEKLEKLIEQKTSENQALMKLLDELNKDIKNSTKMEFSKKR